MCLLSIYMTELMPQAMNTVDTILSVIPTQRCELAAVTASSMSGCLKSMES